MLLKGFTNAVSALVLLFAPPGIVLGQEFVSTHEIIANHPAFERLDPLPFQLYEIQEAKQALFYLDVESVICADHICKIVPVRMLWDDLGHYVRYELAKGVFLEKGEGEPFLPGDYQLLHEILKDDRSPYIDLTYHEVTHEQVVGEGQADGISGATTIILDRGQTVVGATWTCFTLWHWANGDVNDEVRRITGARADKDDLVGYLQSGEEDLELLSLTEIIRRKSCDPAVIAAVVKLGSVAEGEVAADCLRFLEDLESEKYLSALTQLYGAKRDGLRQAILRSLLRMETTLDESRVCRLIDLLPVNPGYQEVDYLLRVIEQRSVPSRKISRKLLPLLNSEDFLVSRRVYYQLSQRDTDEKTARKVENFYARWKDRL